MHQVTEPAELGATIDEYHTRFQIKYLAVLPQATGCGSDLADHQYGRSYPEVLMEINFPSQILPHAVLRMRKVVLFDDLGYPDCMVFTMRKTTSHNAAAEKFSELLTIFSGPAAITHAGDGMVVAANAAYLKQSASNPAMQKIANCSAIVEIDGQAFRLIHEGQVADTVSVSTSSGLEQSAASGVVLLDATRSITLDAKMRIVDVSQLWLSWLGYTRDAVIGRRLFELMPASMVEQFERETRFQPGPSSPLENVPAHFMTKDGEIVHALISAATRRPEDANDYKMIFSICADVSPQKRLEKSLAVTFAIAPVPMLVRRCDDGRIIEANEAFLAMASYAAVDVFDHSFDEFCSIETLKRWKAFEPLAQTAERGDATEVTLKTGSGDKLDCVLTATKIWMLGNDCMLLVLQDVSDRRRTELELMSALEAVMNDNSWFSRSVVERLAAMRAPPKSGRRAAALGDLTPRERDVLSLISLGLPDIEIAERLGLTKSTIRNHLSTLYSKIDVKNRGSAIIWARDRCLNVTQLPLRPQKLQSVFGPGRPVARKPAVFGQDAQAKSDVKVATAP